MDGMPVFVMASVLRFTFLQYPVLPDTPHIVTHKQHAAAMEASKQTGSTQIVPDSSRP